MVGESTTEPSWGLYETFLRTLYSPLHAARSRPRVERVHLAGMGFVVPSAGNFDHHPHGAGHDRLGALDLRLLVRIHLLALPLPKPPPYVSARAPRLWTEELDVYSALKEHTTACRQAE